MFNRALDWDLLDQSPMKGIKFLPKNNARIRYLSREECDRLVESCIVPHLRAIVTVALHTGMRSGKIRSLKWNDLDFDSGFIIIRDSKNGEPRHVPMDSTVVGLFRNYPRTQGSEFVFTNAAGGRLGWVQHGFRKALARAGLSDLHFHDLRHTFASQWMHTLTGPLLSASISIRTDQGGPRGTPPEVSRRSPAPQPSGNVSRQRAWNYFESIVIRRNRGSRRNVELTWSRTGGFVADYFVAARVIGYGRANAKSADPAGITTYCLPSTSNVIAVE
jgi:hypothetical protein